MSVRAADPRLAVRVGAIVLLVVAAAIVYLVALRDRLFLGESVTVEVRFGHLGALADGAPVMVAGTRVGEIAAVKLAPRGAGVIALARIDAGRRHMVPVNGDFFVSSRGIFAERYLEIGPPRDGGPPARPVEDGDVVDGAEPPQMDRVFYNTWNNLTIARAFLDELRPEASALFDAIDQLAVTLAALEPAPGEYDLMRERIGAAVAEARTTWATLEAAGATPDELGALADRARATLDLATASAARLGDKIDVLVAELGRMRDRMEEAVPGLEAKIRKALSLASGAFAKIERVRAKVDELAGMVERGEGTLGRIQTDPEFPEDAKELGRILKQNPWRVLGHPQDEEP
jgi:ABC-type transporter Mla subunit MlaD